MVPLCYADVYGESRHRILRKLFRIFYRSTKNNSILNANFQSSSSEGPKHVLGGTKNVSVATIYRTCFSRSRLKFWRFLCFVFVFCTKIHNVLNFAQFYRIRALEIAFALFWLIWYSLFNNPKYSNALST
ncbi:hypothetical protein BpHYR1_003617 [Brachionus plicatilis]|uniref:Uncharacterized protein n=1 Tax=Brachionus plicatilis TaxID=10195 RepID=A0A3M7P848_BRAPC|nr:hypothetical protein BpHYR1_003617 [Brachionus plicatilis]